MSSDVDSEAPSETALMVYATLANSSKVDPSAANPKVQSPLPTIEEDQQSDHSHCSERSNTQRSESSVSGISKKSSKSELDNESDEEPKNIYQPPLMPSFAYPTEILREAETTIDLESEALEKQSLLLDLQRLKLQGIKLSKDWNINDKLEDMTLEIRRHTLHMDEMANVQTMRDGLRFVCTGVEMLNNRIGLLDLEGWSSEVCKDLSKHDANLSRIYRKYWRRTGTSSPELDITASLVASMGMYHFKQKMGKKIYDNRGPQKTPVSSVDRKIDEESDDDDEEGLPP